MSAFAVVCLTSCGERPAYAHYESVHVEGWAKGDTLHFCLPPQKESGTFTRVLGLRINDYYPFTQLSIIMGWERISAAGNEGWQEVIEKEKRRIIVTLFDEKGNPTGTGINHYQYLFTLSDVYQESGDSLHAWIVPNMTRDSLTGVADVGLILRRPEVD